MNNPNPFVPQGSLLEQQSKRRSRLKLGVLCVLAVGIAGLAGMLIQGCKREESDNTPPPDTNTVATPDTNMTPTVEASNLPPSGMAPPSGPTTTVAPPPPPPPTPPAPPTETEYVVVKGDYYAKIAKQYGIGVKALEEANPNIPATKLKVGQKLVIPAGASTTGANAAGETANGVADANGEETYVVKSGDTLSHLAKHYGVTVKAIQAENNLTTTRINVGQKLKIPAKPEAGPAPVNAPPATATPEPAPMAPPASAPATQPPVQPNPSGGQQQ